METDNLNYTNRIRKLNNFQLIEVLNNAGYELLGKIIQENKIDGASLLYLTELDTILWKLAKTDRISIWESIMKIKKNPEVIFKIGQLERNSPNSEIKNICKEPSNNIHQENSTTKIEQQNKFNTFPLKHRKNEPKIGIAEDTNNYVNMTKSPNRIIPAELLFDDDGYLKPTTIVKQSDDEPDYYELEPPVYELREHHIPIEERPPQTLPRQRRASHPNDNIVHQTAQHESVTKNISDVLRKSISKSKRIFADALNRPSTENLSVANQYKDIIPIYENTDTIDNMMNEIFSDKFNDKNNKNSMLFQNRPLPKIPEKTEDYNHLIADSKEVVDESDSDTEPMYINAEEIDIKNQKQNKAEAQRPKRLNKTKGEYLNKSPKPSNKFKDLQVKKIHVSMPLKTSVTVPDEDITNESPYDVVIMNLNDEPYYRNTDRKGASLLLENLKDGAFLFRPSKVHFLTLSIKHSSNFFNIGIELCNNKIRCQSDINTMAPEFTSLKDFVKYFTKNPIVCQQKDKVFTVFLNACLPADKF